MVWPDYVLETTENKDLKGVGGIIGLTMRGSALARWFITRPVTGKYSQNFRTNVCENDHNTSSSTSHHSERKACVNQWNSDCKK